MYNNLRVYLPSLADADCCARTPAPPHLCLSTRKETKDSRDNDLLSFTNDNQKHIRV